MSGFLLAFWTTSVVTVDRLVFALGMSLYILIGLAFEERALRREFGAVYEKYEAATPRLIPLPMNEVRDCYERQRFVCARLEQVACR